MRRFPNNLSAQEMRTYRRWTAGLYLTYLAVILVAIGLTFANRPGGDLPGDDLRASPDIRVARSEPTPVPASDHSAARPAIKP